MLTAARLASDLAASATSLSQKLKDAHAQHRQQRARKLSASGVVAVEARAPIAELAAEVEQPVETAAAAAAARPATACLSSLWLPRKCVRQASV